MVTFMAGSVKGSDRSPVERTSVRHVTWGYVAVVLLIIGAKLCTSMRRFAVVPPIVVLLLNAQEAT
jgi:hypothetical protein